jgi:hypothetical protein
MIPAPTVTHDIIEHWTLSHEIREAILHWYGERAAAVDRAELPTEEGVLHAARSGWLGFGIPRRLGGHGDDLTPMIEVLALAARSCFASAFALWSQRMLAAYLAGSENGFLREEILPLVLRGERFGSTGLANAMRHVVGLEPLGLRASWVGDDLVVNGRLPWASNLVPEAFIVAIAAATEDGRGVLTAVPAEIPGLVREDDFSLVALDATATTAVRFESARISRHWLISDDLGAFLGGVRPTFLLL